MLDPNIGAHRKAQKVSKEPTVGEESRITLLVVWKSWTNTPQRAIKGGRRKR